jgi:tripartite-type tricarboxylate transporter receptor subunit TctC
MRRSNPGKLNFGPGATAAPSQVAFEQIKQATGTDLMHVPFQGAAAAITAVAAGEVQAFVVPLSSLNRRQPSGRVKLLCRQQRPARGDRARRADHEEQGVPVTISGWHCARRAGRHAAGSHAALEPRAECRHCKSRT